MKFNLWSEYRFRVLWYFVAFIFGVASYFGLPREPNWILCVVFCSILMLVSYFRKRVWIRLLFCFMLGLSMATVRTHFIHTEFMRVPQINKEISGVVVQSFSTHTGQTIVLDEIQIPGAKFVPKRVRVYFKQQDPQLHAGDRVSFVGNLYSPDAYQSARFFYQGLSAKGQMKQLLFHQKATVGWLDEVRFNIMNRLRSYLNPAQWEIAIPLVVGEQGVVSSETYERYRKAGIAHVLSVSGFHMMLLATFVFFLIRGLLALFPYLALRLPTKKIAAVVAFFVTGFYLLLSGMQVPAIRSFMMIAVVFLGVLTDRKVVSLYTLGLVACCVLLFRPEWVASVSFQFSFVAVMVLVGVFEDVSKKLPKNLFMRVFVTALIANVFVSIALAPFVVYHFNQVNPYGIIGNLLTSILFSFFVMPLLFIGTTLMPFGLEVLPLKGAGFVLDQITYIANMIAGWAGSELTVASFAGIGLGLIAFGIVMLCALKTRIRLLGLCVILIGIVIGYVFQPKPDLMVFDKGKTILIRQHDGMYALRGKRNWCVNRWLKHHGQVMVPVFDNYVVEKNNYRIALFGKKCKDADLAIISRKDKNCTAKDVFWPKRQVGYEIYIKDAILIRSESWQNRFRPWSLNFKRKEKNDK